jgi:hypothetical protein
VDGHVRQTHGAGKSRITVEDWVEELAREMRPEPVPPGWLTPKAIAAAVGSSQDCIDARMRRGVSSGQYESRSFRISTGPSVREVIHYRKKP